MSDVDDLRKIANKVAEMQPWDADETWPACVFCGLDQHDHATRGEPHAADCVWVLAQKLRYIP